MQPFKIKICGVTTPGDAVSAAGAGADAIGLNFYERSLRSIKPDVALEIVTMIPKEIAVVGVFVNHDLQDIRDMAEHLQLAAVQLHGDESPEVIDELGLPNVIRAVRIAGNSSQELDTTQSEIEAWCQRGVSGILVDKAAGKSYGGSGKTFDWTVLEKLDIPVRTILAGGLTPENVAAAIETAKPDAVDVASGVEDLPGSKDKSLVGQFVRAAQKAFGQ